jgi:hypothetical protein
MFTPIEGGKERLLRFACFASAITNGFALIPMLFPLPSAAGKKTEEQGIIKTFSSFSD